MPVMPRFRMAVALACVPLLAFALGAGTSRAQDSDVATTPVDTASARLAYVLPHGAGTGGGDVAEVEPNDAMAQANAARDLPFQRAGTLATPGDVDFVSVAVTEYQQIEADAFAVFGGLASPLDPRLTAYASNGAVIATNDDADGSTPNSRLIFEAPYTGSVYLAVAAADGQTGEAYDYVLAVWPITNPVFALQSQEVEPNDDLNAGRLTELPGIMRGTLSTADDIDSMRFAVTGMCTLVVDLHSQSYGTPLDARVDLYDTTGARIWRCDDMDGADPRFNVILPVHGVYGIRVTCRSGGGPDCEYIVSASVQDASDAPFMELMNFSIVDGNKYIKRVVGHNFDPAGARIEVGGRVVPSAPKATKPTTVVRATPPAIVRRGVAVSVVNPNGRRSNAYVPTLK